MATSPPISKENPAKYVAINLLSKRRNKHEKGCCLLISVYTATANRRNLKRNLVSVSKENLVWFSLDSGGSVSGWWTISIWQWVSRVHCPNLVLFSFILGVFAHPRFLL